MTLDQYQQQITNLLTISEQKIKENESLIEQRDQFPKDSQKYSELDKKRLIAMQFFFLIGELLLELKSCTYIYYFIKFNSKYS